jgi:protein SCO1
MEFNPANAQRRRLLLGLLTAAGLSPLRQALARGEAVDGMADMGHMHDLHDMHAQHHHHGEAPVGIKRSEVSYDIPVLRLLRQDGSSAEFPREMESGRPILLNFIYTSCTAICPLTSQVFSGVQEKLLTEHAKLDLLSISIDPEYDTPARLAAYARKFGASEHWHFYTGTQAASIALQKAFEVYRGDKMNHAPVSFLRGKPGQAWIRLDGLASQQQLLEEYRGLGQGA